MASWSRSARLDAWRITGCAALLVALVMGSRSAFGLFVSPLNTATGIGIAAISLAWAFSQLAWGAAQPVVGWLAARFGAVAVAGAGAVLLAAGSATVPYVSGAVVLTLALAFCAAAGAAVASSPVLLALVGQRVPARLRGLATGVVGAGGSAGQLVIPPAAQALVSVSGWVGALLALAALALAGLPLALGLRARVRARRAARWDADGADRVRGEADVASQGPGETGHAHRASGSAEKAGEPFRGLADVRDALRSRDYWLVTGGFFACGFHVAFLLSHMPGVIELCGLPASLAGVWIGVVGLCNIVGSVASGFAISRLPMQRVLTGLYVARAVGVLAFLAAPKTAWTLYAFAVWMGLTYMATLPPTSGLIERLFGMQRLGVLLGVTMLVHQVGSFLGVWLGGIALEASGGYDALWIADAALALLAALVHLPLREPGARRVRGRGRENAGLRPRPART